MNEPLVALLARLNRMRAATSMTWLETAKLLGISRQYLYLLKSGDRVPGPKVERRMREIEAEIGATPTHTKALWMSSPPLRDIIDDLDRAESALRRSRRALMELTQL